MGRTTTLTFAIGLGLALSLLALGATAVLAGPQEDSPAFGPKDAPVTVILYYDFQCGYCGKTAPVLLEVVKQYKDLVRMVAINVPGPGHAYAEPSAEMALTAADHGKFWEAFSLLFENQSRLARADLVGYAEKLGLDTKQVGANLDAHAHRERIKRDFYHALDIGLTATPTIFVGDLKLVGNQEADTFRYHINEALAKKNIASPIGPVAKPKPKEDPAVERVPSNMIYPVQTAKPTDSKLKVKVGEVAPDFTLPTVKGNKVSLSDYRDKKNVVLSFVPAAWTPVCSEQWPEYNEKQAALEGADVALIGISVDNIPSLYSWTGTMGELWFPVASDFYPHGSVSGMYGVLRSNGVSERAVFLIDKKGILRWIHVNDINAKPDFKDLEAQLEKLD